MGHRLNVTRFFYHWTIGAFNIRDSNDQILVYDELVDNVPIRVYRPQNRADQTMPTIIFYHGGGNFLGSAGTWQLKILKNITKLSNYHTVLRCL